MQTWMENALRYSEMTERELMEYEYEYGRWLDEIYDEGQFWAINRECQAVADLQREQELRDLPVEAFGI